MRKSTRCDRARASLRQRHSGDGTLLLLLTITVHTSWRSMNSQRYTRNAIRRQKRTSATNATNERTNAKRTSARGERAHEPTADKRTHRCAHACTLYVYTYLYLLVSCERRAFMLHIYRTLYTHTHKHYSTVLDAFAKARARVRALERDSRALMVERNRETTEIAFPYENARARHACFRAVRVCGCDRRC